MPELFYTLITGASEGLGQALALEFATRQHNLILVALPGSGLQSLAAFIEKEHAVKVIAFERDLSVEKGCTELWQSVKKNELAINCLVNNAGIGGTFDFSEKEPQFYSRLIGLNVTAPTLLIRLFFRDLENNAPSHILNVGSLAGFFTLPGKQVYSGSKSYLLNFSRSLRKEVKSKGITVSIVCPGAMDTRWQLLMEHRIHSDWLCRQSTMHPAAVARIAVQGMLQKKEIIIPGFLNRRLLQFDKIIPPFIKNLLIEHQMKKAKQGSSFSLQNPTMMEPVTV